ncbi:hypothetical protein M0802_004636 [Mischocyttarus mexicanus]|nr:hypothetical protein M0802_004636 [Mischocyttarus mexicanus]
MVVVDSCLLRHVSETYETFSDVVCSCVGDTGVGGGGGSDLGGGRKEGDYLRRGATNQENPRDYLYS